MARDILPIEYQKAPYFPEAEIEELIVDSWPPIVDMPSALLEGHAKQLRRAVDKTLVAYRQSIYLAQHAETLLPLEQWQISESIADNYRQAFHIAEASRTVSRAYYRFLRNMDIEETGNYELYRGI